MLLAQLLDNLRTGGMAFTQNARQIALFNESIHQLLREALGHIREITPIKVHRHTGNFPVAAQGILAPAHLLRIGVSTNAML